ncbi:MAG: acyltransferase family protein, partial [Sphingomonas sp.]
MTAPRSIAYRPEIDGLRAIAVIVVILFHGMVPGFRAGYIGVDMFFVVSGYLITGILVTELAEGRFSILRFYERRIRRIIPALMLVMLLSIPFALWLMLPDDLENFGQSLIGTTFFANNILLLITTGYFGIEVQFKPLMHTWSLGVEEQYYLLVPLMMWVAWRLGKVRGVFIGIAAVTIVSFLACLVLARLSTRADFLLIFSRGWELGAGSLAMLIEPRIRPLAGKR